MLNEGKVMLMTKAAIYEKHQANEDLVISHYFKEDYIKYGCLKSIVAATVVFWIYVAIYILLNFEEILNKLMDMDYFEVMSSFIKAYVIVCLVMFFYAFVIYWIKFEIAKPGIVKYNGTLRKLLKYYEIEQREEDKLKKRIRVYDGVGGSEEELPLDDTTRRPEE